MIKPRLKLVFAMFFVISLTALSLVALEYSVMAYSIVVDGNASDWTGAPPPYNNLAHISRTSAQQGEYIWSVTVTAGHSVRISSPSPWISVSPKWKCPTSAQ